MSCCIFRNNSFLFCGLPLTKGLYTLIAGLTVWQIIFRNVRLNILAYDLFLLIENTNET